MRAVTIIACLALAGCTWMPGAGPTTGAMINSEKRVEPAVEPAGEAYALLPMTVQSAKALNAAMPLVQTASFLPDTPPPRTGIGSGDAVEVTIVSVNPTGFMDFDQAAVTPIATNTLPVQEVDPGGTISVPPLGRVRVAGMSVPQIESMLTQRLAQVLVEPSVVVRVDERVSDRVAVVGKVVEPGRHSTGQEGARILDLIGAAGGPSLPANELRLILTRDGHSASVRLDRLFTEPGLNIRVWPGDVIMLEEAVSQYALMGAANTPGNFDWRTRRLTLARALGEGGGPNRLTADRHGVFVLRSVPQRALASVSDLDLAQLSDPAPTVLQFDFSSPTGVLAAQQFELRDEDLVYVSDAPVVEAGKITTALAPALFLRRAVPVQVAGP